MVNKIESRQFIWNFPICLDEINRAQRPIETSQTTITPIEQKWADAVRFAIQCDCFSYVYAAFEIGPVAGRLHLQAYAQYKDQRYTTIAKKLRKEFDKTWFTMYEKKAVKEAFKTNPSFQDKRAKDNVPEPEYIKKAPVLGPFTYGTFNEIKPPGARTDLAGLRKAIWDNSDITSIELELLGFGDLAFRMPKFISHWKEEVKKSRLPKIISRGEKNVYFHHGPSTTGKTSAARRNVHPEHVYVVPSTQNSTWFAGYAGQSVVIFDDLAPGRNDLIPLLLTILDCHGPTYVPRSSGGDTVLCTAEDFHITSNYTLNELVPPRQRSAFIRRVTHFYEYRTNHCPRQRVYPPSEVMSGPHQERDMFTGQAFLETSV